MSQLLRWFVALAGLAAVLGAMVSLSMPLALHVVDRTGVPIACGTGWSTEGENAHHEDSLNHQQHLLVSAQFVVSDYAGECGSRIGDRRWLAAGVAGLGATMTFGAVLAPLFGSAVGSAVGSDRTTRRRGAPTGPDSDAVSSYAAS